MIMKSLETLLLPVTEQVKQEDASKQEASDQQAGKHKKKADTDRSLDGLDYLKNGLVRCRLCKFSWDGDAQHDCPYNEDDKLL